MAFRWVVPAILCGTGLLAAAVFGQEGSFNSDRHRLTIEVPEGWKVTSGEGPEAGRLAPRTVCDLSEGPSGLMSLGWTVIRKQGQLEDCADLQREGLENLKRGNPGWEFIEEPGVLSVRGRQVLRSVAGNDQLALVQHAFLRERIVYRLTGMCPRAKLAQYQKVFERTAASLTFWGRPQEAADLTGDRELARLGLESQNRKDFELAIEMYESALTKDPSQEFRAEILYGLSSAYLEQGNLQYSQDGDPSPLRKSIEWGEQCLRLKPGNWLVAGNIATAYRSLGRLEKAEEYYLLVERTGDKSHPSYRQLMRERAASLETLKEKDQDRPAAR